MNPLEPENRPAPGEPPPWKLERYLLGELPENEMRALREREASDPALAGALAALRAEHGRLRAEHPAADMSAGIARRLAREPAPRRAAAAADRGPSVPWGERLRPYRAAWVPAFGLVAVLALLPFTPFSPYAPFAPDRSGGAAGDRPVSDGTRIKGLQPRLQLHRKAGDGAERLRDGDAARAGDLIRIQYEGAGRPFGAILSLDAEGRVTRHFPDTGERAAPLGDGGPVALPFAYELDEAAGWERFYLVTADRPFRLDEVEAALRGLGGGGLPDSLVLPAGMAQAPFTLRKESGI